MPGSSAFICSSSEFLIISILDDNPASGTNLDCRKQILGRRLVFREVKSVQRKTQMDITCFQSAHPRAFEMSEAGLFRVILNFNDRIIDALSEGLSLESDCDFWPGGSLSSTLENASRIGTVVSW